MKCENNTGIDNKIKLCPEFDSEILENITDAMFIFDRDGNYTAANKAAREYCGYMKDCKKTGKSSKKIEYYSEDEQLVTCDNFPAARVLNGEKVTDYRLKIKAGDLTTYTEVNGFPIYDDKGNFFAGLLYLHDVTEKEKYLEKTNHNNVILSSINRIFNKSMECATSEELALACLDIAMELTKSSCGFINEFDSEGNFNILAISYPKDSQYTTGNSNYLKQMPSGLMSDSFLRKLLIQGKPFIVNDTGNLEFPEGHIPVRCFLGIPLLHCNKPFGFIVVSNKAGDYNSKDQEFLEAVSASIVQVIANKNTEQMLALELAASKKLQILSRYSVTNNNFNNILDEITSTVIEISNANMCSIRVADAQSGSMKILAHSGLNEPYLKHFECIEEGSALCREVYERKERITIEDVTKCTYFTGQDLKIILDAGIIAIQNTPLLNRSGILTGMLITYFNTPYKPNEHELDLLDIVARQISDIIEHMQADLSRELLMQVEKDKNQALNRAMEIKDEFLSIISHEFKTPLTVINSAIQAMETICGHELSEKSKWFLRKIRQNSYRQLRLVNNLLDITCMNVDNIKVNPANRDIVFITKVITEAAQEYAGQKNITIKFDSAVDKKIIGIDEEKYERIILNLLSNAIKFTPDGKSIHIRLSAAKVSGRNMVCVEVEDEGIGIPEDKHELVFEKFGQVDTSLTRNTEGTGIGLSLVRLLVSALNGTISLKSKTGSGSIFTLLLPDAKVKSVKHSRIIDELSDSRLVHAIEVEFSDIYL